MKIVFHKIQNSVRVCLSNQNITLALIAFLVCIRIVSFYSRPMNHSFVKKQRVRISGIIASQNFSGTGEKSVLLKGDDGLLTILHIPLLPWNLFSCRPEQRFEGNVSVYPLSSAKNHFPMPVKRQAWPGKGYRCECDATECSVRRVEPSFSSLLSNREAGDSLGLLFASILGDKRFLSAEAVSLFRELGISHLLVVSGFHLGAVFGMSFVLVSTVSTIFLSRYSNVPSSLIAALCSWFFCFVYILTIEAGSPSLRAFVMLSLSTLAFATSRSVLSFRNLALAAALLLLFTPSLLVSPGFLLSMSAVFGLLCASRLLHRNELFSGKCIRALIATSFAWLFSAPIVLVFFNSICLLAPLSNLIILPIYSFAVIVVGGILMFSAYLLPKMTEAPLSVYLELLDTLLEGLMYLSRYLPLKNRILDENTAGILAALLLLLNATIVFSLNKWSSRRPSMSLRPL